MKGKDETKSTDEKIRERARKALAKQEKRVRGHANILKLAKKRKGKSWKR